MVAEEDRANHRTTTSRNGQASQCSHCCTSRMTEVDGESSDRRHLSEYPNDAWASRISVIYNVRLLSETRTFFFSLNAIVDVRRLRRRREMIFLIIRKLLELTTSRCTTMYPSTAFTLRPEMTSQSTSDREQVAQTCSFWVMFGCRFLDIRSTDSENVYSFGYCDSSSSFSLL